MRRPWGPAVLEILWGVPVRATIAVVTLALSVMGSVGHAQPGPHFEGEVTDQSPQPRFDIDLEAGQVVTLSASSDTGLDTVLTLYGPDGAQVAMNDDRGDGTLNSQVIYAAPASGRYTAVVTGYAEATGTFELDVAQGADVGLSSQARSLVNEVASLSEGRTEVRYSVELTPDEPFVASTFAVTPDLDTTLTLIDPNGDVVAENDDRGDGTLNSQIVIQPARAGTYVVAVSSFGGQGVGDTIVSLAVDPNAEAPFNFDSIERASFFRQEGEITDEQPEVSFAVELQAGQTILAMAETVSDDLDPVLTLSAPDGSPVAMNDDRGDGTLNSAIAFEAPVSGVYSLQLERYTGSATTGAFVLDVSNIDAAAVTEVRNILENPVRLSGPEVVISSTDFRLHYTLEGGDATTPEFAQLTLDTLQAAYDLQVGQLGWAAPIRDADGRYRAYVGDADGAMGYMNPVQVVFDNPNTPSVREGFASRGLLMIHNDLSEGRDETAERLMHATAVHEFNHLVQFGYDAQEGLGWMYESTASWIEIETAGEDEDAVRYADTDFAAPGLCWTTNEAGHDYGQWTLLQSLADAYGSRVVVRLWENAATHDGFETMSQTLAEHGSTIPEALRRWRIQNFARDYAMAPRLTRSVASAGSIKRDGTWSAGGPLEELGAAYVQLRARGARRFTLSGPDSFELVALGVRDGEVEIIPLGRSGVFDTTGYDHATLMVFNAAVPGAPGVCNGERYEIEVAPSGDQPSPVQDRMDAVHFEAPGA